MASSSTSYFSTPIHVRHVHFQIQVKFGDNFLSSQCLYLSAFKPTPPSSKRGYDGWIEKKNIMDWDALLQPRQSETALKRQQEKTLRSFSFLSMALSYLPSRHPIYLVESLNFLRWPALLAHHHCLALKNEFCAESKCKCCEKSNVTSKL